jgi:hypothetical protein
MVRHYAVGVQVEIEFRGRHGRRAMFRYPHLRNRERDFAWRLLRNICGNLCS